MAPTAQIPTINALAGELGVAVVTVRQAVELLEQEGMLKRRQGKGTFVARDAGRKQIWLEMNSTWSELVRKWEGIVPRIPHGSRRHDGRTASRRRRLSVASYRFMRRLHSPRAFPMRSSTSISTWRSIPGRPTASTSNA